MPKPNYGYLKRQKQIKKQQKKELKAEKKKGDGGGGSGDESLAAVLEQVRERLASMDPENELHPLGENILQNEGVFPEEISLEMAQDFLERTEEAEEEDEA